MKFLILVMCCIVSAELFGQGTSDTNTIRTGLQLCLDSININPKFSKEKSDQLLQLSKQAGYRYGVFMSMMVQGTALTNMNEGKKALAIHEEALNYCRANKFMHKEAMVFDNLGQDYVALGDYQKSQEMFQQALQLNRAFKDTFQAASTMGRMSQGYAVLKYYDKAIYYANQAALYYDMIGDPVGKGRALANTAAVFIDQNKFDSAAGYLQLALKEFKKNKDNPGEEMLADFYTNMGICYEGTGKKDSAFQYYSKALQICEQNGDEYTMQVVLYHIANASYKEKNFPKAELNYKRALEIANRQSNMEVINAICDDLGSMYADWGRYKEAYEFRMKAKVANDSLFNREKLQALTEMNVKFETQQLELKNSELQKKVEAQKYAMLRTWFFLYGGLSLAAVALLAAFFYVGRNRYKTRLQNMELEQKQYRAQMNPHFIFNCMNSIQHFIVHNDVISANKFLSEFATLMRRTLDINAAHFVTVQDEINYLENYLSLEQMRFDGKFSYRVSCPYDIDKKSVKLLPMMLQPFVENAIQHGVRYLQDNSGKLNISFKRKDGWLVCTIDDNGIGRKASAALKGQSGTLHISQGISLIEKRLSLINKIYKTTSGFEFIDKYDENHHAIGTTVILKLPLSW